MISDDHYDYIVRQLNQSGITNSLLKDDLIDHLCCLVEIEINKGKSFEDAFTLAKNQTAPNGFNEIQQETLFLLNYNKILIMKKFTYTLGFIFTLAFTIGLYFKLMSLQFANMLLFGGGTGIAFIFIPLLLINKFKEKTITVLSQKMKWFLGALSVILFMLASWMKLGHIQGAPMVLALSFFVFGFGFLPFLFFRMYKKSTEKL